MDLSKKWEAFIKTWTPRENCTELRIEKAINLLQEMFQLGALYASEGDHERAFASFLKFVTLAIEGLPNHPHYPAWKEKEKIALIDIRIFEAILQMEHMKPHLRNKLENRYVSHNLSYLGTSPSLTDWSSLAPRLHPFILCDKVSVQPIVLQKVLVGSDLPQTFQKHWTSTHRFGLLYGLLEMSKITVSLLVMTTEEIIKYRNFEYFVRAQEFKERVSIIGCIGTSISEMIDVGLFGRIEMSEIICGICSNDVEGQPSKINFFHLINMSPSTHKPDTKKDEKVNAGGCQHVHTSDLVTTNVQSMPSTSMKTEISEQSAAAITASSSISTATNESIAPSFTSSQGQN